MAFNFKNDLILENERVQLRPLSITDHAFLLPFSLKEPDLWTYSLTSAAGEEKLEKYLQSALEVRAVETGYPFLVFDKKTQKVAGCTRFYGMDFHHKTLNIGYSWYGKEFQRTGLNRHCKLLLLTHAFEALKMERVEFRADAKNAKSIAAMQGIGCTLEGTLRNNCTAESGRRNSVVLSIIKSEWAQVKAALVAKTH
ncbi:MAG: GNAT family N-acetyltransferase [Candidatus Arcticimaribacter sp.]